MGASEALRWELVVVMLRCRWASSTVVVKLPARLEGTTAGVMDGGAGDGPGEEDDPRRRGRAEAISCRMCGD